MEYRCPECGLRYVGAASRACWVDGAMTVPVEPKKLAFSNGCAVKGCHKVAAKRLRILGVWEHVCAEHAAEFGGWSEQDSINHMVESLSR